ncbi:hypothetical protein [Syntrophobacter fumaroxidans]|uniref:hypothetical protein n=1 Tax=Syntrophobacter fumaroxidans TaxID=119484 RepID=UPI0012377720|nr:hypothetical protein [Syntrophobacter fumaroxidans]
MTKQKRAVMIGLERSANSKLKITMDDLIQISDKPSKWIKDVIITFKEYDDSIFEELDFTEKDLADFGYSIIARLYAFYKQGEI